MLLSSKFVVSIFIVLKICSTLSLPLHFVADGATKSEVKPETMERPTDDILPPNHLDAVKLGRDGNFNKDFHKEVFLGEDIKNFQIASKTEADQKNQLTNIFALIDTDGNGKLGEDELADWVHAKTIEHHMEAKEENEEKFNELDANDDGKLSWEEFLLGYFTKRGYDKATAWNDINGNKEMHLPPEMHDEIEETRDRWIQAATDNGDDEAIKTMQTLTVEEFLIFQHPETSPNMLNYMVEDFLHDIDLNGDDEVSMKEFLMLEDDDDGDDNDRWIYERKQEFMKVLDQDGDGIASKDELIAYVNPLNKAMPHQEARQLIGFGDDNNDGELSLDELLSNSEYYTGSKMYNYAKSIHDDL